MPRALDALEWLARDHAALKRLLRAYEDLRQGRGGEFDRALLAERIGSQLKLHLQIEGEIFYPAARAALGADWALAHAMLDHRGTMELTDRLGRMPLDDPDFDALVAVLEAYLVAHMQEVEDVISPRLKQAGVDTMALGAQITQRLKALAHDPTRAGAADRVPRARAWPLAARVITP